MKLTKKRRKFRLLWKYNIMLFLIIFSFNIGLFKNSSAVDSEESQDYWPTIGWESSLPGDQGMNDTILSQIFDYIEDSNVNFHSVIVMRNGYIIKEGYFTNSLLRSASTIYRNEKRSMWSVTKSIVSLCIGIALKEGLINNISQTFFEFYPDLWDSSYDPRKKEITIEDLLKMSSGIQWDESSIDYFDPSNDYYNMTRNSNNWMNFYLNKSQLYDPGQYFEYSAGSSILLSAILQKISGNKTSEYTQEKIFKPLGIKEGCWSWLDSPEGISDGADGLAMTPRDMVKIGLLCLNNGTWDGVEIFPASFLQAAKLDQPTPLRESNYGLHFWIHDWWDYYCYGALGWNGQRIIMFDELNLVVVFTGNVEDYNAETGHIIRNFILPALLDNNEDDGGNGDKNLSIPGFSPFFLGFMILMVSIGILQYLRIKKILDFK